MASWTRAWRPAGWGSTASSMASTSLAEAEMASANWLVARPCAVLAASWDLPDMMTHLRPKRGGSMAVGPQAASQAHGTACSLESGRFASRFYPYLLDSFQVWPAPWACYPCECGGC